MPERTSTMTLMFGPAHDKQETSERPGLSLEAARLRLQTLRVPEPAEWTGQNQARSWLGWRNLLDRLA